jgi:hypothetical protein
MSAARVAHDSSTPAVRETGANRSPSFHLSPAVVRLTLALILLLTGMFTILAMRHTSPTFDEIVLIAGGARGYHTGDWSMAPEHPPLMQYVYGLPVHVAGASYPDEAGVTAADRALMGYRYRYAQNFFWRSGNDPERLALLGRLPAALCAVGLVLLVFAYTRSLGGPAAGLTAALLTAALPDVLAHGGVAYNDVPLALALLAAVWAISVAIRTPSASRALAAGLLIAAALGIKNSAVALAPIAGVLLIWEIALRRNDAQWRRLILPAALITVVSAYIGLVVIYRGDLALAEYRYGLEFAFSHATQMEVPAFLLGERSMSGWWYFFPVAFLFKTSAGLHVLLAVAAFHAASVVQRRRGALLGTPLRAPIVALLVFGVLLLRSSLNIGFRYALPLLPFLCMLAAVCLVRFWPAARPSARAAIAAAAVWMVISTASAYPHFLGYISEYGPGVEENHTILVDSSLDWGQGLLGLRDFMRQNQINSVYLSYFGSALPEGYGISYLPLVSFFPLAPATGPASQPEWIAISATNLSGTYFNGDPFAEFRQSRPDHVIARSIFLYRLGQP